MKFLSDTNILHRFSDLANLIVADVLDCLLTLLKLLDEMPVPIMLSTEIMHNINDFLKICLVSILLNEIVLMRLAVICVKYTIG